MSNFRSEAKKHIQAILVSFKTKNKVVTRNVNNTKHRHGHHSKIQLTPRGQLHKETIYGMSKRLMNKPTKINKKFSLAQVHLIVDPSTKQAVLNHLHKYQGDAVRAFDSKTLKKDSIIINSAPLKEVLCYEEIYTIRKEIGPDLKIDKVVDEGIKDILRQRLYEYDNKPKEAFSNLEKHPIWLNEEKGIAIKRVTITGISNAEYLHHKKNHLGQPILDDDGLVIPSSYISTGNNHHVAIYKDASGQLQEQVVSFYEAVQRVQLGLPIIDKSFNADIGWKFQFTMKQNEMFIFPNEETGFDPKDYDLRDPENARIISPNLYRVQKIASRNYFFRNHLETTVGTIKELNGIAYKSQLGLNKISNITKVRINHIGVVVSIGDY